MKEVLASEFPHKDAGRDASSFLGVVSFLVNMLGTG